MNHSTSAARPASSPSDGEAAGILRGLDKQPPSAWRRTVIDTPYRRHRNVRYLEQTIHVADYEGRLRRSPSPDWANRPTLVLSNNFEVQLGIITAIEP